MTISASKMAKASFLATLVSVACIDGAAAQSAAAQSAAAQKAVAQKAAAGEQSYKVEPGNTLEDFSHQLFNDKNYWRGIRSQNPEIKNPNLIYPGQTIAAPKADKTSGGAKKWRPPPAADHSLLLRRMENELAAPYSDSSAFSYDDGLGTPGAGAAMDAAYAPTADLGAAQNPDDEQAASYQAATGLASQPRKKQYPQFWLLPASARIIATMGPKDDSDLYQVNRGQIKLKRRGEITAKPFCLIRPLASDAATGRRLYRIIARYFPEDAPLAQPFKLEWRHLEARVGDQLSAQCPPSLATIRSRYDGESSSLAIPREEVTVFHPEMRQFILPGQDALWRLESGALPDSIRFLRLYRTDAKNGDKIETARVEILQRSDRNLIVRYLTLANTAF